MSAQIQAILDGKIDFEGQELVETSMRYGLAGATAFSFVAGYATQSLKICFGSFGLAVLAIMLTFVPPWPFLNRHPLKWRKIKNKGE
ncbi:microsomal signal peptidase 12 kDa subunit [Rhizoctonia solani 123E]|uniref:Signal peptidase complex subunit 1 n=1 Tax=Rhizoctonia solani 123E TaxID=1423351 RepID=A0A074RKG2_9AGAM|nr:microsomal signal peptidase 12 kDa subunit [Rhizoctonia solani 123E]